MNVVKEYKSEIAIMVGSVLYSILNYFCQRYIVFKKITTKDIEG